MKNKTSWKMRGWEVKATYRGEKGADKSQVGTGGAGDGFLSAPGAEVLRAAPELLLGEGEAAVGQSCIRDPGNRTKGGTWICAGLCADQTRHKMQKKVSNFSIFSFFPLFASHN